MTQYEKDLSRPLNINGRETSMAFYNLVVSIRDVKLFQVGLRPHRHWRLKHVKEYFGVTGNTANVLKQLQQLKDS